MLYLYKNYSKKLPRGFFFGLCLTEIFIFRFFIEFLKENQVSFEDGMSLNMKHFLANSNEDGRDSTSSDFDNRLFHEYYAYSFYKGITQGGSRAFMASYNSWNGIPMMPPGFPGR